jgi:hypothetical protein
MKQRSQMLQSRPIVAPSSTLTKAQMRVPSPILFVATLRPDELTPWTNFPRVTLLSLNRLGRPASRKLIQMAAGERSLPPIVIEAILARTEGVPLFVEELTKAVLESAIWKTTAGDGDLELAGPLPPLAIPATEDCSWRVWIA